MNQKKENAITLAFSRGSKRYTRFWPVWFWPVWFWPVSSGKKMGWKLLGIYG